MHREMHQGRREVRLRQRRRQESVRHCRPGQSSGPRWRSRFREGLRRGRHAHRRQHRHGPGQDQVTTLKTIIRRRRDLAPARSFCRPRNFRYDVELSMSTILLHAARAVTPTTEIPDAGILIRDGVIEAVGSRQDMRLPAGAAEISASGQTAIPGFIDVHIHGAGGHDVMEGTEQAMSTVAKTLARHGTTSFLATTVTASPDDTCRSVEGIARYITQQFGALQPRAEVLGIHYEGPFINKVRRGVHPAEWIQLPSADLLQRFLRAAAGNARILTIAPEVLGAAPSIKAARDAGVVVAMGRSDATYEQARAGIAH